MRYFKQIGHTWKGSLEKNMEKKLWNCTTWWRYNRTKQGHSH